MSAEHKAFKELADLAMENPALLRMRPVVEKELLHYEIFQALDAEGLLKHLVFQGGTSLRLCRGSNRLSEDLYFAGGTKFSADSMIQIKTCLEKRIIKRFGLNVMVSSKPLKISQNNTSHIKAHKWWISIETAPKNKSMPHQRIKLEIANIPAYTRELVPLRMNYDFLMGMPTVLVNAESLDEIMADKILAFPTSLVDNQAKSVAPDSNKIRHRDIWDLGWMSTHGAKLDVKLVAAKISDYGVINYPVLLDEAIKQIPQIVRSHTFKDQMTRFIDSVTLDQTLSNNAYLEYLAEATQGLFKKAKTALASI